MASNDITLMSDDNPFIRLYRVFEDGPKEYICASRRLPQDMPAAMTAEQRNAMVPDAVSCFVVLKVEGEQPKLLLNWEYRYPAGDYLLSVPAGLIDPADKAAGDPLRVTTIREVGEECGIQVQDTDDVFVVNPLVWSTPGLTDESNALMGVTLNRQVMPPMNQLGAEGTEDFDGFLLVDKALAAQLLETGRDPRGGFYPLFTYAALMYFAAKF